MRRDLSNNKLTGNIPSQFAELKELKSLNLSYNNFVGDIPQSILGVSMNLTEMDVSFNYLNVTERLVVKPGFKVSPQQNATASQVPPFIATQPLPSHTPSSGKTITAETETTSIIASTVSVSILIAILVVGFFLWRRKQNLIQQQDLIARQVTFGNLERSKDIRTVESEFIRDEFLVAGDAGEVGSQEPVRYE
ncbi:UNVERIFIED_CONTAM: hypothetical protein HDU68_003937 [Siphonaria sp. JEL0065]|nr:hypothetical protein HDU68_003937 [Siphonaria sp. JEL0065]